jgi:hypothetical protein
MQSPLKLSQESPKSVFETLYNLDISDHVQTRMQGGRQIDYLEWATAWKLAKEVYPTCSFTIQENKEGLPYFETPYGLMVHVSVQIEDRCESDWYPVDAGREGITTFEIAVAHQRALVKTLGRHGLGLKLWEKAEREEMTSGRVEPKPSQPSPPLSQSSPRTDYIIDLGAKNPLTGKTLEEGHHIPSRTHGISLLEDSYNWWRKQKVEPNSKPDKFLKATEAFLSGKAQLNENDLDIPF